MDIVERLRNQGYFWPNGLANEAADEIERLRKELKDAQEENIELAPIIHADGVHFGASLKRKEIERLREALRKIANEEEDCFPIQTARDALKEKE